MHDIGKLTAEEFKKVKEHTYYTRRVLEKIDGFSKITEWASNHHEKLNDFIIYNIDLK